MMFDTSTAVYSYNVAPCRLKVDIAPERCDRRSGPSVPIVIVNETCSQSQLKRECCVHASE